MTNWRSSYKYRDHHHRGLKSVFKDGKYYGSNEMGKPIQLSDAFSHTGPRFFYVNEAVDDTIYADETIESLPVRGTMIIMILQRRN